VTSTQLRSSKTTDVPRKGFWKPLSLCLLAVLVVSIILSTLLLLREHSLSLQYAEKRLKERRCEIMVDERRPPQPIWSEMLLGSDRLNWAHLVRINKVPLSKYDARLLSRFPRLSIVVINSCPAVNDVVPECRQIPQLKEVYIYECDQLDAKALRSLAECSELETLVIDHDRGALDLSVLSKASKLQRLTLFGTGFGDETAIAMAKCPQLISVKMIGTRLTDRGLSALCELPSLQTLVLREANLTGVVLAQFANKMCLRELDLSGSRIGEVGLIAIGQIKSLRTLVVDSSQASDAQLTELREALPGCAITASDDRFDSGGSDKTSAVVPGGHRRAQSGGDPLPEN
jgi:Leucine Rich repeat